MSASLEGLEEGENRWGCGTEALPKLAHQEQLQGVRGREHLPAPAHQEHLQGVRGREDVPHVSVECLTCAKQT